MKIEIKHRYTNKVIYSCEAETIKEAVEKAVKVGANLGGANLRGAYLRGAYLGDANLGGANLRDANLRETIKLPMYCKWTNGITNGNLIHIGCEKRTIEEWDKFFNSDEKLSTERGTEQFKQIQAVYEAYKAYLTFLNK